jgi:solute carrier family 6 GABA transporter-like protein 1
MTEEVATPPPTEVKRMGTFATESSEDNPNNRDRWGGRVAFYLAAIGSAVGFGNVWRFPALAKDYGGGAFFIPYLMALFIVGLPVLILEISLGQYYQAGNVACFGSFHPRFRGVGMCAIVCGFMLVVYYSMLLSWVTRAFFESFGDNDPWAAANVTGQDAVDYFYADIIGMNMTKLGENDLRPTMVVGQNVGYSALVWVCIWACLAFGMKWTGRIAYFSMGLPIVLLFVFLIKGVTLPGADEGIREYIGEWDMKVLTEQPDVWSTAVSQIFFSLSVTFGTMTAYGSHCPRREPAFVNSVVVGISNSMFSFLSGFAVFAAMGNLAYRTGTTVDEIPYAGFSLVFGTWPVVFGTLAGGENWVRLLFFDLFLLGIDSAFSILEAPLTVAMDWLGHEYAKWKVAGAFSVLAYLLSIMYATDAGLFFLDSVDFYVNFVFLMTGFFETLGAGWIYDIQGQIESLGAPAVFTYMFTHFGSIIIACGLWFGLNNEHQVWAGFLGGFLCFGAGCTATFYFLSQQRAHNPERWNSWSDIIYELCLGNVMRLRSELSSVVGYLPWIWAFAMKNMIPQILLILFINLAQSKNADGESLFGHYEGYVSWPYQVLGILIVAFACSCVLVGIVSPKVFEGAVRNSPVYQQQQQQQAIKEVDEPAYPTPENVEEGDKDNLKEPTITTGEEFQA